MGCVLTPDQINTILWRLDKQDEVLGEIESQVKRTNGRVSKLETEAAVARALAAHVTDVAALRLSRRSWLVPCVVATCASVASVLLSHLI